MHTTKIFINKINLYELLISKHSLADFFEALNEPCVLLTSNVMSNFGAIGNPLTYRQCFTIQRSRVQRRGLCLPWCWFGNLRISLPQRPWTNCSSPSPWGKYNVRSLLQTRWEQVLDILQDSSFGSAPRRFHLLLCCRLGLVFTFSAVNFHYISPYTN